MTTIERIAGALGGVTHEVETPADGMPCLRVAHDQLRSVFEALKGSCGFEMSTLVTAVDHSPNAPRFELVWQFLSIQHNDRVRVRCISDDEFPSVPTIIDLWPGAAFFERECYDMFGVRFDGHDGLKRLLMPQAYEHHPLRKEFPHRGIEPDKLYREWDRKRRLQEGNPS